MFAGPAAGGRGSTPGTGRDQQPDRGALRRGIGSPAGVTSAGSFQPSRNFNARKPRFPVDTTALPAAGGRGADCQCFSVSCSSRPHWSAAAATKPTGPPSPRGTVLPKVLYPAGHPNRTLHWQGSTLALPGRRQGGQGVTISGPLRTANRTPAAQTCMPREAEA